MDEAQRGRRPSANSPHRSDISHSASPHTSFDPSAQAPNGLSQGLTAANAYPQAASSASQYSATQFAHEQQLDPLVHDQFGSQFMSQDQGGGSDGHLAYNPFDPQGDFADQGAFDPAALHQQFEGDTNLPSLEPFDDSIFVDFDPSSTAINPPASNTVDYPNSHEGVSAVHQQSPDASHLLHPEMQHSLATSAHSSPSTYQDPFPTHHNHTRNASLDPSSAAYPQGVDWQAYRHRRTPSDQRSDISSNHHSPFLGSNADGFEPTTAGIPSPMLNGAQDASVFGPDALGFNQFSLNDQQAPYISPNHSSHPSPYLAPQRSQQTFEGQEAFDSLNNDQYSNAQNQDIYPTSEPFPSLTSTESLEIGKADQMSPPEIRFDPAPPSKQPSYSDFSEANFADGNQGGGLNLPSNRSRRAISDPHTASSRHTSSNRDRSPSLGLHPSNSLISGPPGGIQKSYHHRRSSSPAVAPSRSQSRERMLEMATQAAAARTSPAPSDAGSGAGSPGSTSGFENGSPDLSSGQGSLKRTQKHPATFECHLCPKRFTRAYNLRSHLRTHTDERPFVCTVCGKAFARQHDRKRHEGLHSGEKKFICRGTLSDSIPHAPSNQWGCGRRFARADALGRHFRSEAGRACIKPLLDEEARQRQQDQAEQRYNQQMLNQAQAAHLGQPMDVMNMPPPPNIQGQSDEVDYSSLPLPAVLLAQFPALRDIQWNAPPGHAATGQGGDYDNSDYDDGTSARSSFDNGARSSFDASSGGEWDDGNDYGGQQQPQQGAMHSGFQQQQQHWNGNMNSTGSAQEWR